MGKMGKHYSLCLLHIRFARVPISSLFLTRREGGTYDRTLDLTTRILSLHTTNLDVATGAIISEEGASEERPVSPLELFFDLFFAALLSKLGHPPWSCPLLLRHCLSTHVPELVAGTS